MTALLPSAGQHLGQQFRHKLRKFPVIDMTVHYKDLQILVFSILQRILQAAAE